MPSSSTFLAFDLGAESGRALAGHLNERKLVLEEVHRFANGPIAVFDTLHWDVLRLWGDVKTGLSLAGSKYGAGLAGIGLDTWGVDFALLGRDGALLGNPYHYGY